MFLVYNLGIEKFEIYLNFPWNSPSS